MFGSEVTETHFPAGSFGRPDRAAKLCTLQQTKKKHCTGMLPCSLGAQDGPFIVTGVSCHACVCATLAAQV
jgi:hypothetical protein